MSMAEAAERFGVPYARIRARLDRGWTGEDAIKLGKAQPLGPKRRGHRGRAVGGMRFEYKVRAGLLPDA